MIKAFAFQSMSVFLVLTVFHFIYVYKRTILREKKAQLSGSL